MDVQNLNQARAFATKDGSVIRELLSHRNSAIRSQSLAEAKVEPGLTTLCHYHVRTEEIYYILSGVGHVRVGEELRDVAAGDAIAIPPGEIHQITNTGQETLVFLCSCSPGYEHEDTVLIDCG
jgi:mannose-6-phosphate isomerase-like protein (cupin superfamily)